MLFKNSSIYILAKAFPGLAAFLALSVYTHLLTPSEYGVYTLIFSAALFLHSGLFNWLPVGTMRFWPGGAYTPREFISTLVTIYIRITGPLLIVLLLVMLYFGKASVGPVMAGLLLLAGFAALTANQQLQSAMIDPQRYAKMTLSYAALSISLGALMAWLGYGPIGVVVGVALGMLLPVIIFAAKDWIVFDRTAYTPELTGKLMIYGMPLAASFFLDEVANLSDRYMLAYLVDEAEAGKYAVGYDLAGNSIMMVMNAVNMAAYPMIVKLLDTEGRDAAMEYFNTYAILLLGLAIPAVAGLSLVGPTLVELVIGEDYQASVIMLLPWVSSALFFMGLGAFYLHLPFQLGNKNGGIFKIAAFTGILNLALNIWLIPRYGMMGAAIATVVSFGFSCIPAYIMGQKVFRLPFPRDDIVCIVLSAVFMSACLWPIKDFRGWHWLLIQLFVGLGSYLIAAYLLNIGGIRQQVAARFPRAPQF